MTLAPGQSGLLLFGAYQAGGAAGEPLTPEEEIITDDDQISDEPEDPNEDEVVTAEPANRIFLPLGYR